jgi:hypothetical protein
MATTTAAAAPPVASEKPLSPEREALVKLTTRLPEILKTAEHGEMWGVELKDADHVPTQVVLQKFLRANENDVANAEKQLTAALKWRKEFKALELVNATYDKAKFGGLGYLTVHKDEATGRDAIFTWNIYGAVKDNQATFGNVKEFIRWRAALMEMSVHKLNLNAVTELIPDGGEDPYRTYQVHDYQSVSFFRMDPAVRAASKETIETLSLAYPELLAHKYFVNVPFVMGWMYGAMKLFLAPATLRKFHPMSSGLSLAAELPAISASLPTEYGGKGPSVKEGMTLNESSSGVADAKKDEPSEVTEVTKITDVKNDVNVAEDKAPIAAAATEPEKKEEKETAVPVEAK